MVPRHAPSRQISLIPTVTGLPWLPVTTTVPWTWLSKPAVIVTEPERAGPLIEYGVAPPIDTETFSGANAPSKTVPVSSARVGLLVAETVAVTQAGVGVKPAWPAGV